MEDITPKIEPEQEPEASSSHEHESIDTQQQQHHHQQQQQQQSQQHQLDLQSSMTQLSLDSQQQQQQQQHLRDNQASDQQPAASHDPFSQPQSQSDSQIASDPQQPQSQHQQSQQQPQPPSSQPTLTDAPQQLFGFTANARTSAPTINKNNIPEDLFSSKRWGTTPIRQDTPWELPPSPTQPQQQQHQQQAIGSTPIAISPGISQSGDSFHGQPLGVNNLNLVGGPSNVLAASSSRFDQSWRAPIAPNNKPTLATSASFANHNLMNPAPGGMQKSLLNSGNGRPNAFGSVGLQQGGNEFARAPGPGPASSLLDSNSMTPKPFGMAQRVSTWSSFGAPIGPDDSDSEWPKSTASGISSSGANPGQQPANAFDLVHDFEPGKSWHGSNLMKSLDDDSPINIGSGSTAFPGSYGFSSSKSPTGSQYEPSGIGTWSPVIKGNRSGSMWDGDGQDGGRGDNGRFDDGTAIWGSPAQSKVTGADWVEKTGESGSNNDKSRSSTMAGNNQSYRQQSSSSNNQQTMKQNSLSHNFDQVQQSNALSNQANQPNRGLGLSSNVPSKHQQQLTTMVQQIQLAVQAGHLNPQILNQPLAPVTLQLLYQLLQQIRSLHQLQLKFNQPGNHQAAVSVQMTKTKQNILNLQNQIAAQQAMHLKQQTQAHNISSRQQTMPGLATGGIGGGIGPALPPGISQSGDSFHGQPLGVNNMGLMGGPSNVLAASSSRFDQSWRAPIAPNNKPTLATSASFANHNLMNPAPGGMQKSLLNSGNGRPNAFGSVGLQQGGNEFARAPGPGPASSLLDSNSMTPKPFGMAQRVSTWSSFGAPIGPDDSDSEWPKSTASGISSSGANPGQQPTNAFDLVHEFEPGKPWRGSMLMRSVEDDPTMTPGSMARSIAPQRKTIWSDEIL